MDENEMKEGPMENGPMEEMPMEEEEKKAEDEPRKESLPNVEWLDKSHLHVDKDKDELLDAKEELVQTDDDVRRVLSLLEQQRKLHLSDKQLQALREARLQGEEHLFAGWNDHQHKNYSDDEEERVKDFDQNHRLEVLWNERPKWVNYLLAFAFHLVVLVNFLYCLWER